MRILTNVAVVSDLVFNIAISILGVVGCVWLGIAAVDATRKYLGKSSLIHAAV